nr:hypothetical protein BaRGS_005965 [Batillaria attramentaria]
MERAAFRHLTNLRVLELKGCDYISTSDNAFADTQLTKLDLGGIWDWQCDCDSLWLAQFLADEVNCDGINVCPSDVGASVVTLRLSNCRCGTTMEQSEFSRFTNLTVLELKGCEYTTIGDFALSGTQLSQLTITGSLQTLSSNSFSGLSSLTTLALDHNHLAIIQPDTFTNMNIGKLDISSNPLTTVKAGAFAWSTIGTLTLTDTRLTTLPEADSVVMRLTELDLGGIMDWECDCRSLWLARFLAERSAFRHLTNLRELEIKSCGYTSIFDNAFADTQLTKLDLGGTVDWQCDCDSLWLAKFLAGTFANLNIGTLDISFNPLTTVEAGAFAGSTIGNLTLKNTNLTSLPEEDSAVLTTLSKLDLGGTFANLNIAMLDISFNPLTTVEAGAFTGSNITNVILKNTQLTTIQPDTFSNTQITTLDLSSSPLKTVEAGAFTGSTITNVILKNTQVTTIQPDTFSNTQITTLDLSSSPLKTVEAGAFIGNTIVTLLLKDTQLTTLPEADSAVLARLTTLDLSDIPPAETELPINCDKPSKAEIRKAIMTLRNGKAAGPDEIPAEAIKADTETAVNMLHSLFSKIWEKEEVPAQWKEGIVIKLPKKGDLRDCSNYRGIMLLSVPGKVLNRILLERMREAVDPMLRDQQAGFRRNRSCADQIASLRIIVEQSLEWNSPLYINFIDYEKAFDSVDREALWKLLRHYGVPGKIISLTQCTYQDMSCRIAHAGQLSESFEVKTGVRQGCLLSPFLFLLVIDWIMKTTTAGRKNGIQWTLWTQLDDLDFADDLALLSHSHSQMQDKTTCLEATSAGTGLTINRKKTELMKINTTANTPVTVGGEPIREVESFVYLGSVVDGQGGTDRDVTARIGKARAAMVMLKNVWASKVVSIRTKLRIFNSNVKSVLLYGCETWRTTKTMQQKIQTFLNTCLRRIFNIRWPEKIRNEELWERAGQEPVAKQILWRKWGWIGHTLRKPASSTTRQALTWNPQGKRKRGRPRNSWRRDTEAELCKQGTNWTGVARLAQNRVRWRRVVDGLCSTWSQGPK